MYASEQNCSEDKVSVESLVGARYRASGCNQTVVYQCFENVGCIPDGYTRTSTEPERDSDSVVEVPVTAVARGPQVESGAHRSKNAKGESLVVLNLRMDRQTALRLAAAPDKNQRLVQLKIVRTESEDSLQQCQLQWMLDGTKAAPREAKHLRDTSMSSLYVDLPLDEVKAMGGIEQMALRACNLRWSLTPPQVAEVRRFVQLWQEDLAWSGDTKVAAPTGMLAPGGGWPDWYTVGAAPAAKDASKTLDAKALFKLLSPSVLKVEVSSQSRKALGSAVAVSSAEALTNCHVLEGAQQIKVSHAEQSWPAEVVRASPESDRCVLRVKGAPLTPIAGIRTFDDLEVGEKLFTLGSPNGLELTLADGILSGQREEQGRRYVQTTAPISPGSSGGGLFDARGNLVGITTMVLIGRDGHNQSLNFAIPADSFWQP